MVEELKIDEARVEVDRLVEEVLHHIGDARVVEIAVHEQETLQELELGEGEVGRYRCTSALFAVQTDANVRLLDHGHVVGAVADGGRQRRAACMLDHLDYVGLLRRRHAAA